MDTHGNQIPIHKTMKLLFESRKVIAMSRLSPSTYSKKKLKELKDGGMVTKSKPKVAGRLAKRGYGKAMKGKK